MGMMGMMGMGMGIGMGIGMGMGMGMGMRNGNGNGNRNGYGNELLTMYCTILCLKSYTYPVSATATYTSQSKKAP
jgi:hypothetical protein